MKHRRRLLSLTEEVTLRNFLIFVNELVSSVWLLTCQVCPKKHFRVRNMMYTMKMRMHTNTHTHTHRRVSLSWQRHNGHAWKHMHLRQRGRGRKVKLEEARSQHPGHKVMISFLKCCDHWMSPVIWLWPFEYHVWCETVSHFGNIRITKMHYRSGHRMTPGQDQMASDGKRSHHLKMRLYIDCDLDSDALSHWPVSENKWQECSNFYDFFLNFGDRITSLVNGHPTKKCM